MPNFSFVFSRLFPGLPPPAFDEEAWRAKVGVQDPSLLYAPHRRLNGVFFNPWYPQPHKSWWRLLRWWASRSSAPAAAARVLPPTPNDGAFLTRKDNAIVAVGHSTFALKLGDQVMVTDPFFQARAFLAPRRVAAALPADIFPPGTVVLISHNHYDHLDRRAIKTLARRQAVFICPLGLKQFLQTLGARNVHELDWWRQFNFRGFNFTCLPAQHWSLRFRQRRNTTLWSSWLIDGGGRRIFFSGDSGYFVGFAEFGRCFADVDLALLPAGACLPRWMMAYAHLNVEEMFKAFHELKARRLIPMHWGSIKLGDDPLVWPLAQIERHLQRNPEMRARVEILRPGQQAAL